MRSYVTCGLLGVALTVLLAGPTMAAMPEAPKVSTFASADDLVSQLDAYVADLEKAVSNEEEYKDAEANISKQSNTLVLIALALGLHDSDNKYKAAAPAIVKAAQALGQAKDLASTKKGVEAVKAAVAGKGEAGAAIKWEKVASLPELMKQVPNLNTKLKRGVSKSKLKSSAAKSQGHAAVIAVIAQGSMADTSATKSEAEAGQWYKFCAQMRDAAAEVNAGVKKLDAGAVDAAMKKLNQSCDDCHEVFHKKALEKKDADEK
jgi:hypothetical protein